MGDAKRTPEKEKQRLWRDVGLLEGYLDRIDAHDDEWQYARSLFYLAQTLRSLGFRQQARDLWQRFLQLSFSQRRTFSYLTYGAHVALGQLCAEEGSVAATPTCAQHFEEAHRLCPRAEPLIYLALSLPLGDPARLQALRRAEKVLPMQASTVHCAIFAEPGVYANLP